MGVFIHRLWRERLIVLVRGRWEFIPDEFDGGAFWGEMKRRISIAIVIRSSLSSFNLRVLASRDRHLRQDCGERDQRLRVSCVHATISLSCREFRSIDLVGRLVLCHSVPYDRSLLPRFCDRRIVERESVSSRNKPRSSILSFDSPDIFLLQTAVVNIRWTIPCWTIDCWRIQACGGRGLSSWSRMRISYCTITHVWLLEQNSREGGLHWLGLHEPEAKLLSPPHERVATADRCLNLAPILDDLRRTLVWNQTPSVVFPR